MSENQPLLTNTQGEISKPTVAEAHNAKETGSISGSSDRAMLKGGTSQKENDMDDEDSEQCVTGYSKEISKGPFVPKSDDETEIENLIKELPEYRVIYRNDLDYIDLLEKMKKKFENKRDGWNNRRATLSTLNFLMALVFFSIQAAQIISAQLVDPQTNKVVSTVLPVVASVFVAVYQLLDWSSKASKCKTASNSYSILVSEAQNRLEIINSKGYPTKNEIIKLWQIGSSFERNDPHPSRNIL